MNRGVPPTEEKARTGEFTPPGMTPLARANNSAERAVEAGEPSVVGAADEEGGGVTSPVFQTFLPRRREAGLRPGEDTHSAVSAEHAIATRADVHVLARPVADNDDQQWFGRPARDRRDLR